MYYTDFYCTNIWSEYNKQVDTFREIQQKNLSIICQYTYFCFVIFNLTIFEFDPTLIELKSLWDSKCSRDEREFDYGTFSITIDTNLNLTCPTYRYFNLNYIYLKNNLALMLPCEKAEKFLRLVPDYHDKLHKVNEIIGIYPLYITAYNGNKVLIYRENILTILSIFYSSGIAQWLEEQEEYKNVFKYLKNTRKNETAFYRLNLMNLFGAFLILIIGYILALSIFVFEHVYICMSKRRKKRRGRNPSSRENNL